MSVPLVFVTTATAVDASGFDADEANVRDVFGRLGPITSFASRYDSDLRRFGFEVVFATKVAVEAALHLDGVKLRTRQLAVTCSDPQLDGAVKAEVRARREADGPEEAALKGPTMGDANATAVLPHNDALPEELQLDGLLAEPLQALEGSAFADLAAFQAEAAAVMQALATVRPKALEAREKLRLARPDTVAEAARKVAVDSRVSRTVAVHGVPVSEDVMAHVAARMLEIAPVARYAVGTGPGGYILYVEYASAAGAAAALRQRPPGANCAALVVGGVSGPLLISAPEDGTPPLPPPQLPSTWGSQQQRSIAPHALALFAA